MSVDYCFDKAKAKRKRSHGFWSLACWRPNSLEPGMNEAFLNVMFLCLNVIILSSALTHFVTMYCGFLEYSVG